MAASTLGLLLSMLRFALGSAPQHTADVAGGLFRLRDCDGSGQPLQSIPAVNTCCWLGICGCSLLCVEACSHLQLDCLTEHEQMPVPTRSLLGQSPASLMEASFSAADTTTDVPLPVDLAASLADTHDHPVLLLPTALWVAHMLWFLPWDPGSLAAFRLVARQLAELRAATALKPAGRCDPAGHRSGMPVLRASLGLLLCLDLMLRVMHDCMSLVYRHCGASSLAG